MASPVPPTGLPRPPARMLPLLLLAALAAGTPAQQRDREVPKPQEFLPGKDDNLFSLPRSQEDIHAWEQALAELERGELQPAVERLHNLLQHDNGGVAPIGGGRFCSLRLCVVLTLANLSPAATATYETLVRREAGALADRSVLELDRDQLRVLAERYPTSAAGRRARLRLGDLLLEAGDGFGAMAQFRAGIDAVPLHSSEEESLRTRLQAAAVLQNPRLYRTTPGDGSDGETTAAVLSVLPQTDPGTRWPAYGSGAAGARMDDVAGTPKSQWSDEISALGFEYGTGPVAMQPVGDVNGLFLNTGVQLIAYDPLRKAQQWASPVPLEQVDDRALSRSREEYAQSYNNDMVFAAACGGDVVVAALQVPENSANVEFHNAFRIINKIPERRLFAFHRTTGKLLWSHFDQLEGPLARLFRGHSVSGPPLVVGDTVYAPVHDRSGAIAFALGAYDLRTGQPRFRKLVCSSQQEVNMFGNARMEFASSPLLHDRGVIYGASNLGLAFALDATSGQVRWLTAYDVTALPKTQLQNQMERRVYFANNAPALCAGVVAMTPLDSAFGLGFAAETGRCLWRLQYAAPTNRRNDVRWLCGTLGDEFVFSGAGTIAVKAAPPSQEGMQPVIRQLALPESLPGSGRGQVAGRPAVTGHQIWVPTGDRLVVIDSNGQMAQQNGDVRLRLPGNLLLVDGLIISLRERLLEVQFDAEALRQGAEERLRQDPGDPAAILALATLRNSLLADGSAGETATAVEQLYRRGLEAAEARQLPKSHPLRQALQKELFLLAQRRAASARDAGAANAAELLRQARELAPDLAEFLRMQTELVDLLEKSGDNQGALAELDVAVQRGSDQNEAVTGPGKVPLRAFALYRRAQLLRDPQAIVAAWQQLLELHPDVMFAGQRASEVATAAIAQLLQQHGASVYAPIEARAREALTQAGTDESALRALASRFPHATATSEAQTRLVDLAVGRGDLAAVVEVLASALRSGDLPASLLRRGMLVAQRGGNLPLARALADRLAAHRDARSDWPADQGATMGSVIDQARADLRPTTAPIRPGVPKRIVAQIPSRSVQSYVLLPTAVQDGFAARNDAPLYVRCGELMLALDLHAAGTTKPVLFQHKVDYVDQILLCGNVAILADLYRTIGLDYRTGETLWELPNPENRSYECLGVQSGVLHLSALASEQGQGALFLGVEPMQGSLLFSRSLPLGRMGQWPKPVDGGFIVLETPPEGDPVLHRLDPLTGRTVRTVPLVPAVLKQLGLRAEDVARAKLFPQGIAADQDRIYLPIERSNLDGPPQIAAIDMQGRVAWNWKGKRGRGLMVAALRADHYCVVERGQGSGSRVLVLNAADGAVLRELAMGQDITPLNFQRSWMPTPAPAALVIIERNPAATLNFFAIDDALQSFQQGLTQDDDEGTRQPIVGDGFVTFGMQTNRSNSFRLWSLRLAGRQGTLPEGDKFHALKLGAPYMVGACGPYTVIASDQELTVFGDQEGK